MPSTELRQTLLTRARRVVVKIGTQLLTDEPSDSDGASEGLCFNRRFVAELARQIAQLRRDGVEVTLVSSGAIGCGCVELGLTTRPTDVAEAQAVAAVGQRRLVTYWADALAAHDLRIGQVLLTRRDFDDRGRFLHIRNCLTQLHRLGCVPVLNENDTVAVEEIRFGDNDLLAALTCNALRADALVLLTGVAGLLDQRGHVVDLVNATGEVADVALGPRSRWGSGGMVTKLEAARVVTGAGEIAVIASGRADNVLPRLLSGEKLGTLCAPADRKLDSRSRWIGLTARPSGVLVIDAGAARAVCERGKSLLATGVTAVEGGFDRGDVVLVRDAAGRQIARGLSNYPAAELRHIRGRRSDQFEAILGRPAYEEVIHRDNLVVLGATGG